MTNQYKAIQSNTKKLESYQQDKVKTTLQNVCYIKNLYKLIAIHLSR